MEFDAKNIDILNLLQEDSRMSLTEIASKVDLSVDAVKRRIEKLREAKTFFPRIQLRPRHFGYPQILVIRVKLKDYSMQATTDFIEYLKAHPRVTELYSISGEWDLVITVMSKDHEDFSLVSDEIRNEYGELINDWSEALTKVVYKFETYDLKALAEYEHKHEGRHV